MEDRVTGESPDFLLHNRIGRCWLELLASLALLAVTLVISAVLKLQIEKSVIAPVSALPSSS